ncbi:MAG: M48 family metalloprotease [Planctomycetes bacterium]|nr:M48 family metalloprotease [Planctomycetota bacterium]
MAEILSSIAAAILQWWIWILAPAIIILVWIRAAGERRAASHDVLLRALVAGEFALLVASAWFALSGPAGPRVAAVRPAPAPRDAPPAEWLAGARVQEASSPGPDPRRAAESATRWRLPSLVALRARLPWPAWASGILIAVYAAGCASGLRSLVREARRVSALRKTACPIDDPRIRAPIPCLACDDAPGVFLAGWRSPAILIASSLLDRLSGAQLCALVAHEIAHRVRRDIAWQLAARILALIAWPIVVNRMVLRRMRFTAEVLCDRLALDGTGDAESYASMLAEAASGRTVPLAAGASAKSFLRRRVEMVLGTSLGSARAGLSARAGVVFSVIALLALPVACMRVVKSDPQPAPVPVLVPPETGGGRPDEKLEPSPEVKAAQKALAESWIAQARTHYAAAEYENARACLREAFSTGALREQVVPLADGVAALGLGPAAPDEPLFGEPIEPFLLAYVRQRYGPFDVADPSVWVDEKAGVLVLDRPLIERIHAEILGPGEPDQAVSLRAEFLALAPDTARKIARSTGFSGEEEMRHTVVPIRTEGLGTAMEEAGTEIQRISAPCVTAWDRQQASILICDMVAYIGTYRLVTKGPATVADPVVSTVKSGIALEVLPVIEEGDAISIGLRATLAKLKGMNEVRIDLPNAAGVPIAVPDLETIVQTVAARLRLGEEVLLSLGELRSDEDAGPKVHWLRLKAERIAMPPEAE